MKIEEKEQASEPDVVGKLKLSDQEFTNRINILNALMNKVGSMQEQIGNENRESQKS